ncbi:MAG: twin-arginine translocase TatA/TatE family subunit [Muribaculaceae bacterium]|nr:twin-arginine translocase TatA/TatE family subunit [Muribaculaceae bacterium]
MITSFFNLGAPEIILIVFVILLLFGGKKIPELMKGIGKGVRSFRQGMSEISDEIQNAPEPKSSAAPAPKTPEREASDAEKN